MRKLFVVFFIMFYLPMSFSLKTDNFTTLLNCFNTNCIKLYINFSSKINNKENFEFSHFNGISNIYLINANTLNYILKNDVSFAGLEFTFNKDININKLLVLLGAFKVFEEKIGNITIIYAYSSLYSKNITANNYKINFQICINENAIKLGYPLLLGGY